MELYLNIQPSFSEAPVLFVVNSGKSELHFEPGIGEVG